MALPPKPSPLGPRTAAGLRPATSTTDPVIARIRRVYRAQTAKAFKAQPWLKQTPLQTRPMVRIRQNFWIVRSSFYWKTLRDSVMCEEKRPLNKYFLEPATEAATSADYRKIVKTPMDFGTMTRKWDDGAYRGDAYSILSDFNLLVDNAVVYYPRGHPVHEAAEKLREIYEECAEENWAHWMNDAVTKPQNLDL